MYSESTQACADHLGAQHGTARIDDLDLRANLLGRDQPLADHQFRKRRFEQLVVAQRRVLEVGLLWMDGRGAAAVIVAVIVVMVVVMVMIVRHPNSPRKVQAQGRVFLLWAGFLNRPGGRPLGAGSIATRDVVSPAGLKTTHTSSHRLTVQSSLPHASSIQCS